MSGCFDYGVVSGCDEHCPVLWDGHCDVPGEVVEQLGHLLELDEWETLCRLYPGLDEEDELYYKKLNKEESMDPSNVIKNRLTVQKIDREGAASKLANKIEGLTKTKAPDLSIAGNYFSVNCEEIFADNISVPVRVTCYEDFGLRRVFVNGIEADVATLRALLSAELIESISALKEVVTKRDATLGCEGFSETVSKKLD